MLERDAMADSDAKGGRQAVTKNATTNLACHLSRYS